MTGGSPSGHLIVDNSGVIPTTSTLKLPSAPTGGTPGAGDEIAAARSNLAIVGRRRGATELARSLAVEALRLYTELGFDGWPVPFV